MEEVFKQIASIKEEYACSAKQLQLEQKSTTIFKEKTQELAEEAQRIAKSLPFDEKDLFMAKMELGDVQARMRMAKIELEGKVAERTVLEQEMELAITKQCELTKEVQKLMSPDDYKQKLLDQQAHIATLNKEIQQELKIKSSLTAKIESLKNAETQLRAIKLDIQKLKGIKTGLLEEMAALEKRSSKNASSVATEAQIQKDLEEAQQRYQYLCAHLSIIQ